MLYQRLMFLHVLSAILNSTRCFAMNDVRISCCFGVVGFCGGNVVHLDVHCNLPHSTIAFDLCTIYRNYNIALNEFDVNERNMCTILTNELWCVNKNVCILKPALPRKLAVIRKNHPDDRLLRSGKRFFFGNCFSCSVQTYNYAVFADAIIFWCVDKRYRHWNEITAGLKRAKEKDNAHVQIHAYFVRLANRVSRNIYANGLCIYYIVR